MKKTMKICAVAACAVLFLSSCSSKNYSNIAGYDTIMAAKEKYAALESGHLVITDNSDGKITQDFMFKYEGEVLTYSYMGSDDTTTYYEYHNGSELDYCDNKSSAWSYLDSASEDYYVYSRSDRHTLTTESVISLSPDSISGSEVTDGADGTKIIHYTYDVNLLNTYSDSISQLGKLTSFEATFVINADGYCTEMNQTGEISNESGDYQVNYTMTISEMNTVEKVTRPAVTFETTAS